MSNNNIYGCGCCENAELLSPEDTSNFPGLSALQYRVGTHFSFKQSMLDSISAYPALNGLTSRYDDDFAVAALDSWATVLDVLSFYQERIINEGYLRTARERLSVLQLASHISYRLKPGVAASTFLAFDMNEAQGAPASAIIPAGTKVQSVPAQNQLPQVFETVEQIEARVEWNSIKLQTEKKFIPVFGDTEIYVKGIVTGLQPGDGLLMIGDERQEFIGSENWDFRKVKEIFPDKDLNITKITWSKGLGVIRNGSQINPAAKNFKIFALRQKASLFGYNAPDFKILSDTVKNEFFPSTLIGQYFNGISFNQFILSRTDANINFNWNAGSPDPLVSSDNFSVRWTGLLIAPVSGNITFYTNSDDGVRLWLNGTLIINNWTTHGLTENSATVSLAAGQLCSIILEYFEQGGAAVITLSWSGPGLPKQIISPDRFLRNDWPGYNIAAVSQAVDTIYLDNIYPKIVKDSWLVISTADYNEVYNVDEVNDSSRKAFTLASKTTAIKLAGENLIEEFNTHISDAAIYAQSEQLEIADKPVMDAIQDYQTLMLAELMPGLYEGQNIIITGKRMRLQITEAAGNPFFTVKNNPAAQRNLAAGEVLIILKKPENEHASAKQVWTLKDSGSFEGTIEVSKFDETIDANKNDYTLITAGKNDDAVSELNAISSITIVQGTAVIESTTVIVLKDLLTNYYDTATVEINANIASATHGETKQETLGNGNSAKLFQKFNLKQNPLTYVSDAAASGTKTTLQVRVNDILWKETPSFYDKSSKEKVYTTSIADDGKVTVQFGNGVTGALVPGGINNITANYRVGIGSDGLLDANQLSMLMTPQLGVSKVTNPLPTSGAADSETLDEARENAPFTVLTLDRIVSVTDFENFTRAYAGIGKARAEVLWNGEQQEVYITIASANKDAIDEHSDLYEKLVLAIQSSGHTYSLVSVHSYQPITFSVSAGIQTDNSYIFEKVKQQVILSLQKQFSFEMRDFGQDVTLAEIMTAIQSVEGLIYVDIDKLNGVDPFAPVGLQRIASNLATRQGNDIVPAQLLTIGEITISQLQ